MKQSLKAVIKLKARYKNATILIKNLGDGFYETVAIVNRKTIASITERRGIILRCNMP